MKIITRNQLYKYFIEEFIQLNCETIGQMIFKSLSDEQLAAEYGLSVLRPGYFY